MHNAGHDTVDIWRMQTYTQVHVVFRGICAKTHPHVAPVVSWHTDCKSRPNWWELLRVSYTECGLCKIRMIVCLMLWPENQKTDRLRQHWCSVSRSKMNKWLLNQQTSLILLEHLMSHPCHRFVTLHERSETNWRFSLICDLVLCWPNFLLCPDFQAGGLSHLCCIENQESSATGCSFATEMSWSVIKVHCVPSVGN